MPPGVGAVIWDRALNLWNLIPTPGRIRSCVRELVGMGKKTHKVSVRVLLFIERKLWFLFRGCPLWWRV